MADPEHLEIIKKGIKTWNKWRQNNLDIQPDLSNANLNRRRFSSIIFKGQYVYLNDRLNLSYVNLQNANLNQAVLTRANLSGSNLTGARLGKADLWRAKLAGVNLSEAYLFQANLQEANLTNANLREAKLSGVDFSDAILEGTDFTLARSHPETLFMVTKAQAR